MKGTVDHIICDPPFLSDDCQTKSMIDLHYCAYLSKLTPLPVVALTIRWLLKPNDASQRVIVCTGERMQNLINKLYKSLGVKTTSYKPKHANGLSNEFYCYANFECEKWKWRD